MKTLKNFAIALVAISFVTTSCVENTLSPQVEAIREQQVEWMKAKVAAEAALVDYQKAETAYRNAQTANQEAMTAQIAATTASQLLDNAQKEKMNLLTYNLAVATNAAALKNAEKDLATADAQLKKALNDLAVQVAKAGDDLAAEYYTNYNAQATTLSALYASRLTVQNNLGTQNLLLAGSALGSTSFLDNFKKTTQAQIDADNITLTAQKAALTTLNTIVADPTTILAEINTLNKSNTELGIQKDKLNADLVKANNSLAAAYKVYYDGQNVITKMNGGNRLWVYNTLTASWSQPGGIVIGLKNELSSINTSIANQLKTIAAAEVTLSDANSNLLSKKADLANKTTIYNQEKANYDPKVAAYNVAKDAQATAQNDYNIKLNATNIAFANWDKVTADANKTKYLAAKAISDAALVVLTNANNDLSTANNTMLAAATTYNSAKNAVTTAENAVTAAETTVANAEKALQNSKDVNTANGLEKASLQSQITALTASFNTEVAKQFEYAQNVSTVFDAVTAISDQIAPINASISQNNNLIATLTTYKSNIEGVKNAVIAQKAAIVATEKLIADNTALLTISAASNAKAATEANIAKLTKELEVVNTQISAAEKTLAYWKGLLDKIFA